jgi:hypothetical protein
VTDYYNLSGVLTYAISPTSRLSLSAGPALIQSNSDDLEPPTEAVVARFPLRQESDGRHFLDATTCPQESPGIHVVGPKCKSVAPALTENQLDVLNLNTGGNQALVPFVGALPSTDDSNTTYFASATLSKQWEHWSGGLSYTRSAGQSTAVASVSDVVSGGVGWRIARRWTANLSGSFQRREQANENFVLSPEVANQQPPGLPAFSPAARAFAVRAVQVDSGAGVDVMTANLRVTYQLARRTSLSVSASWREQSFTGDASSLGGATSLALNVGLNYYFDPVNF